MVNNVFDRGGLNAFSLSELEFLKQGTFLILKNQEKFSLFAENVQKVDYIFVLRLPKNFYFAVHRSFAKFVLVLRLLKLLDSNHLSRLAVNSLENFAIGAFSNQVHYFE